MPLYDDPETAAQYAQYATDSALEYLPPQYFKLSLRSERSQTNGVETAAEDTTEPPSQKSELERYWEIVKANPDDFVSWEYLIRIAESAEDGLTPKSPAENITNMREVFDQFLAKFPLCFGYWKKYADFEFTIQGATEAEKIYERGVAAIANSVDLWTQYCAFRIEHYPDDLEAIRGLFERGAAYVGLDFLSHLFWDKYIEFEKSMQDYVRVMKILDRIIRIPIHQYTRFFEDFNNLLSTRPITELLSPEQYKEYEEEVKAAPPPPTEEIDGEQTTPTEKTEEQIQNDIRTRVYNLCVDNYTRTHIEVNKRWVFEQEIKRPYFHVKEMDVPQLTNWRRYLDFEESEGDDTRIQVLYERCLVACALYEEFWQRYARWMITKNRYSDARNIYIRATSVFIPISIRLSYVCLEEQQGNIEEVRNLYKSIMESSPGHVETIMKYTHFERRRNPDDLPKAINILTSALESDTLDEKSKPYIIVQYAKMIWHHKKSVEDARQIFQQNATKCLDSKYFWWNWFKFEISQNDSEVETRLKNVIDMIRNTTTLTSETIRDIQNSYLDFLMERGSTISLYNKIEAETHGPITIRAIADSKKRSAEEAEDKPSKQLRVDGIVDPTATGAVSPVVTPAVSYAAQPPYYPQGQWNAQGYAGYPAVSAASSANAQQAGYQYPYQYSQSTASTTATLEY
ncbi:8955_t:CDS:10 [Funneliformis geosporum]|uniref:15161_t:CDS:1 n=1 Tax=Funneliformis geosporum TaxID=1117311 RepID=A0A9W4T0Y5_9GLOM|nr:8955_t:CDS:10 [Funneliformis geosporum]CAI2190647.1 15161_t:CDS:10 [Funneliformis geosporum]